MGSVSVEIRRQEKRNGCDITFAKTGSATGTTLDVLLRADRTTLQQVTQAQINAMVQTLVRDPSFGAAKFVLTVTCDDGEASVSKSQGGALTLRPGTLKSVCEAFEKAADPDYVDGGGDDDSDDDAFEDEDEEDE
jgi:hypothetical protein